MEEALRKLNIPYRIYGGLSFYKRKEIKDLLAYFRLVINLNDEEAMLRIINFPTRGIGQTTIDRIRIAADAHNMSMWQIMDALDHINIDVNQGTKAKIADFVAKIKSYHILLKTKNAYELAKNIAISTGIMKALNEDDTPEGVSRIENIEELLNAIKDFSESTDDLVSTDPELAENTNEIRSLEAFMQDIALLTDADNDGEDDNNKVSMMTIHAAKGLEFPYVFVVGLEENLFPSIMSISSRADLEEERRLFYVAITRAEVKLTLSYAEMRYRWGDLSFCEPSRFIEEIDIKYLDFPQKNPIITKLKEDKSFIQNEPKIGIPFDKNKFKKVNYPNHSGENFNPSAMEDIDGLQIGMEVEHDRFGVGRITNLEGSGPNKKATVNFRNIGNKQLLLKFAKLKIVS
jgi:DNA helicase-2/ATP-dependent DNA helicase PcrA